MAVASAILLYTYLLYPLAVMALARLRPRPVTRRIWRPPISFIITAHNEERDIAAKLENTLALEYPRDRLQILVSSDGSTDGTHAIVDTFRSRGVRLIASSQRAGKTRATQRAVREATGELLVFSDATGTYNPTALQELASAAADPSVGCVCGRVEYARGGSLVARGHQLYWWLEKMLRRAESACSGITVVSGSIHAVRKDLFPSADAHQNYDLLLPLALADQDLRTIFEYGAVSTEEPSARTGDEFRARVRAGIRAFSYLSELHRRGWVVHNPFFAWAVISHKVLRWFSPFWLLLLLAGHCLLATGGGFWLWALFAHLGLYLIGALGAVLPPGRFTRWLSGPAFLGTACAGFFVGLVRFLRGQRAATWETAR